MLYLVQMTVTAPTGDESAAFEALKLAERERALELQRDGRWVHLWRVVGRYANVSVFNVDDHDALHEILSSLPLFPYMEIDVIPLARHPSAL